MFTIDVPALCFSQILEQHQFREAVCILL